MGSPEQSAAAPVVDWLLAELEREGGPRAAELIRQLRKELDFAANHSTHASSEEAVPPAALPDFKAIFEGLPGLFLILDPNLHVVAASDAYLHATLTRREEIIGRHLFEIFPENPDDPSADSIRVTGASLNRVLQTREPDVMVVQRHDVRRPEAEGGGFEVRYWSPVNSPLLRPDGSIAYIIHRTENVTEFMLLKHHGVEQGRETEALRDRAMKVEAELYSRSREVAEASLRLKQANEELATLYARMRELDAFKSQFFANVSHELRTPLTLILGPVRKLLAGDDLGVEQRHALSVVERNAGTLLKHVNDLLDLSKLDAGRMEMEYAETNLGELTRYVASHFESMQNEKEIQLVVDTPDAFPGQVDRDKLQRVLFNLLSNAFKFTPARGAVQFRLIRDGAAAVFSVEDTGPGIPPEKREHIFERFRQLDSGATRRHEGTGLGLAIAKEFVGLHQGAISVDEAPGGGARFIVEIPVHAPAGAEVKTPASEQPDARAWAAELRKQVLPGFVHPSPELDAPLVLVVEDNPEMNAFIADSLATRCRVVQAADGERGLETARRLRPDLVVTDLMMPRLSGEDLVRAIRGYPELDHVRIIVLTARADEGLRVRLLRTGAQDCLVKPFDAAELVERVSVQIEQERKTGAKLRESEMRYRNLFNAIDEGFCTVELIFDAEQRPIDYRFIETNPAFEQQTGLTGVVGKRAREVAPGLEQHWFEIYGRVAMTGEAIRFQNHSAPLGRWFDVYAFRIGAPEQRQVALLFSDITELRRAEAALQEACELAQRRAHEAEEREQLVRAMMEHIPLGITIADAPDVTVRAVSRYGRELLAKPPEQLVGAPASEHPQRWEVYRADGVTPATAEELPLTRATLQGEIVRQEEWVVGRSDGLRIPILCHAAPIRDKTGRITGGVIGWQDITQRKLAEQALAAANAQLEVHAAELEKTVADRTAQLRETVQELEAFSYSLTHDLRAPLRAMKGFAQILESDYGAQLGAEGGAYLKRIATAAGRLDQLIQDVLAYSRIVREQVKLRAIDTAALVHQLVDENPVLQPPNAQVTLEAPLHPVLGHEAYLMQVVSNLVYNAVKFVAPGRQPHVRIWTEASDSEVRLFVQDNGIGIPAEARRRMFGMFQRFHSDQVYEGTGIGLAIVRKAVERMSGSVEVESEPGEGSTFIVRLRKP